MRFSLNFIKEFVEFKGTPESLAQALTMAGMEVEAMERQDNDWVFDVEVTTNRYDWLCMAGIAREVSAITAKPCNIAKPAFSSEPAYQSRNIHIEDNKDCPYYIGRSINNVSVSASAAWLKGHVSHCGLNTINNIVDITNYAMLKWGNPLHAFDDDKLKGSISIRRARDGERFVGIDEKERILNKTNLVIADEEKVVALAGVMGAKNSEVDERTKNVFLEAAIFSPLTVRRSRRAAGLDTDSSYRFERRVSPHYLEYASIEAAQLMEKLAGGNYTGAKKAGRPPLIQPQKITIQLKDLNAFLGSEFTKTAVSAAFRRLGCHVLQKGNDGLLVETPPERFDLIQDVDLYEEAARICGYAAIAEQIPSLTEVFTSPLAKDEGRRQFSFKNELRTFLAISGFKEVMTWSFDNAEELAAIGESEAIAVTNPLRSQENALRKNLLFAMARCLQYNINHDQKALRIFEIADTYAKHQNNFIEIPVVALAATGKNDDFFYLKRAIQDCLRFAGISEYTYQRESANAAADALSIWAGKYNCGWLGKIDAGFSRKYDIKEAFFYGQLDLSFLLRRKSDRLYQPLSLYPMISRDISIVLKPGTVFDDIQDILTAAGKYLVDYCVVNTYQGSDIPRGSTAFTLRLFYQSSDKTLTSQEVDAAHTLLRDTLAKKDGVNLR